MWPEFGSSEFALAKIEYVFFILCLVQPFPNINLQFLLLVAVAAIVLK
jgi:hypothetical protein